MRPILSYLLLLVLAFGNCRSTEARCEVMSTYYLLLVVLAFGNCRSTEARCEVMRTNPPTTTGTRLREL